MPTPAASVLGLTVEQAFDDAAILEIASPAKSLGPALIPDAEFHAGLETQVRAIV